MSEEELSSTGGLPDIKYSDAVRFFQAIAVSSPCPFCKTDSWQIPTKLEDMDLCQLTEGYLKLDGMPIQSLEVECKRCGFVRAHRAEIIRQWLKYNPVTGVES